MMTISNIVSHVWNDLNENLKEQWKGLPDDKVMLNQFLFNHLKPFLIHFYNMLYNENSKFLENTERMKQILVALGMIEVYIDQI